MSPAARRVFGLWPVVRLSILVVTSLLYAAHFIHLTADFPGGSTWQDWSRYTDEGWYSDAAVRHLLLGRWYLPGDFNPAVALPVWPLLEAVVFRFTGVSLLAARALTVTVFGVTLLAAYQLLSRSARLSPDTLCRNQVCIAAPLAVLFLAASPFFFAFERIAILEPLLGALTLLAMLCAVYAGDLRASQTLRLTRYGPPIALGLLLPAMVLTKPTAIALLPAVFFLLWAQSGYAWRSALQRALPPALMGMGIWLAYYLILVRPRFLEDYRYLFDANDYTGFQTEPLAGVVFHTVGYGTWMGTALYLLFFTLLVFLLVRRPHFFHKPLPPALLLWVAGYFLFLGYHNNPQSRYYLLLALPVTLLVALALEELHHPPAPSASRNLRKILLRNSFVAAAVFAVVVPDILEEVGFLRHPTYTFLGAAQEMARTVRADRTQSPLLLSVSGSDLTLMTGLPSINTEFGTLDLDQRVRLYKPGWYVTWNEIDDEDMAAIAPFYQPMLVASYPAMDDPDRNLLLLYRLDPADANAAAHPARPRHQRRRFGKALPAGHHGISF